MGYEQRHEEALTREQFLAVVGDVQDYGAHVTGCAKCGGSQWSVQFCVGGSNLAGGDARKQCPITDPDAKPHLHFSCPCGSHLVTLCKDDHRNEVRTLAPADTMNRALVYLVSRYGSRIVDIPAVELLELDGARVLIDDSIPGIKRIKALLPNETPDVH